MKKFLKAICMAFCAKYPKVDPKPAGSRAQELKNLCIILDTLSQIILSASPGNNQVIAVN